MGARQSKRSVDISSGKEGEAAGGELVAPGGEGRLERIEDVDTLKPQLNGDASHIEISEKEKNIQDNGTPENEKDTSNEKEIILSPVNGANGEDGEREAGDGAEDSEANKTVEVENNKKNKKEKVKKKWSLRSISFSKKDKQKPDKQKQKEETNGDCDKVPEEAADATSVKAEVPEIKDSEIIQSKETPKTDEVTIVDDKTPETPVTEPITNGSSTPETPKEEVSSSGVDAVLESSAVANLVEVKPSLEEPEDLQINGLKIEDTLTEEVVKSVESLQLSTTEKVKPEVVEPKAEIASIISPVDEMITSPAPVTETPVIPAPLLEAQAVPTPVSEVPAASETETVSEKIAEVIVAPESTIPDVAPTEATGDSAPTDTTATE